MAGKIISDAWLFGKEWWRNKAAVGTPFACSQKTAECITKLIEDRSTNIEGIIGRRILETGAGTGVFTKEIVRKMSPNDQLVVVECGSDFCARLRELYGSDRRITIVEGTIQEYAKSALENVSSDIEVKFDHVVGAVPITSLPTANIVTEVFNAHTSLIKPNGTYSQVEYAGTSTLKKLVALISGNKESPQIVDAKNMFYQTHETHQEIVWKNIPPARVHHMRFN